MKIEKEAVIEAMDSIEKVTELFYQQKDKEGYAKFEGTLNLLAQTLNGAINEKESNVNVDIQEFNTKLIEAMNALRENDTVLLADILKYDISPILADIVSSI